MIARPDRSEHDAYFARYIDLVPEGDILEILAGELETTCGLLRDVPPDRERYRYAAGKWSIREVLGHLIDSERMFQYRALSFARQDPAHLPNFDEGDYARWSNAHDRSLADLMDEFEDVRRAGIALFKSFTPEMLVRTGRASAYRFSVRTFPYVIAGHEIHHRGVLLERYLK
ncbi:MAG: DinB family protein [Gemmatimonadetes bacterium]|uniref:DinB family protein n=1 Tax=Candidatus Kutchimonas denitrificans TaxID=3056748 RepID=A0AAE4ZDM1_9BACT|nr:DinB family protein [Gemmatimonadota bacterium]NIR76630.1 DinB family protein [Candidatus Kutchimonas denitrificans]NIS03399.1 DinB family protein [Gemmatimonadota bacterium]NIT69260.1 DinB family protein [Gemmatimonadota bacterium]NIU54732.1 DUF664 domain-containing protein [Gemmatimonadota bacterium]